MCPYKERMINSFLALVSTVMLLGMASLLSSCNKYEIAKRKYATTVVDTTYTTIVTTVPRDSAVLVVHTDCTHIIVTERQGRAAITLSRTPQQTTVKAVCDSIIVEKKVPVYVQKQVWGVDPRYQRKAERRLVLIKVLLGLMCVLILYIIVLRILAKSTRNDPGNETVSG